MQKSLQMFTELLQDCSCVGQQQNFFSHIHSVYLPGSGFI